MESKRVDGVAFVGIAMVKLRPVEKDDLAILYRMRIANDHAFYGWRPITMTGQREWFEAISHDLTKEAFVLVREPGSIDGDDEFEKQFGIDIGFCQVVDIDHRNGTAEVGGFMIDGACQQQGYGSAMIDMLVEFCFNDIGLRKLYLEVFASNNNVVRIYEKLEFSIEGILKEHVWKNGHWQDVLIMAKYRSQ